MRRKLAVVLCADVVGYSARMERNETDAFLRVAALRRDVIEPSVARHNGRVFKTMGDGFLAEFGSVTGALAAAQDILWPTDATADRLPLRIGINMGEVIEDGEDILGDGVNIAARLQQAAEPDTILVSAKVRDEAQGRIDARFEDLGKKQLRNLEQPVHIFRLVSGAIAAAAAADPARGLAAPERPSIVVLPFTNMSGDPQHEFFADGMTEDLITALSRIGELFVISRHSSFYYKGQTRRIETVARELGVRYVLEGSVRVSGPKMRITAQLIDGTSGAHVWAERYDRDARDVFEIQDDIAHSIALSLQVQLASGDFARLWDGQTKDLRAWELMVQARTHFMCFTAAENALARRLLQNAIELDPGYSGAIVLLGLTHWVDARFTMSMNKEACLSACAEQARRALDINPTMGSAHMLSGGVDFLSGRHDAALEQCQRGADLAPSDSWAIAFLGLVCSYSGAPVRAVAAFNTALKLSPHPPAWYYYGLAIGQMWSGQLRDAEMTARLDLRLEPDDPYSYVNLATILCFAEKTAEASDLVGQMLRLTPDFSAANLIRSERYRDPADFDRVLTALRAAGLPG